MQKFNSLTFFIVSLFAFATVQAKDIQPESKHSAQMRLVDSLLANHHYNNAVFNDEK